MDTRRFFSRRIIPAVLVTTGVLLVAEVSLRAVRPTPLRSSALLRAVTGGASRSPGPVLSSAPAEDPLGAIAQWVASQGVTSRSGMADLAREFVYRNSVHGAPAGAEKRRQDLPTILSRLYAHEMGKEAEAPRLTCGPRALALHAILKRLGYACRIVSLFSDEYDNVRSHTFVEVQDPATQRWEVQDPDYNVVYVHDEGGQRLSAEDLVLGDPGTVVPVSRRTRGWDGTSTALLRDKFFEALMVHAKDKTEKSVVLVNTDRFSLEKTFPGNGGVTFADFAAERYGHPAIRRNQSVSP